MSDVYVYLDETGSLDYTTESGPRFAIGSATYVGEHSQTIWDGLRLRMRLESKGIQLPRGFHAKDDSWPTRGEVFDVIAEHPPRFDATYLTKANAQTAVRAKGKPYLYQLALFYHLRYLLPSVSTPADSVFVVAASITLTKSNARAARSAIGDVCSQLSRGRERVTACLWEARSSWGVQVADYGLWAMQRNHDNKPCDAFARVVQPNLTSYYGLWG